MGPRCYLGDSPQTRARSIARVPLGENWPTSRSLGGLDWSMLASPLWMNRRFGVQGRPAAERIAHSGTEDQRQHRPCGDGQLRREVGRIDPEDRQRHQHDEREGHHPLPDKEPRVPTQPGTGLADSWEQGACLSALSPASRRGTQEGQCRELGASRAVWRWPEGPGPYQMGEVQARSRIVFGRSGESHQVGRSSPVVVLHSRVLQRQLGISTIRA